MNDIISRRMRAAARRTAESRYNPELGDYSRGKIVGHIRGFIEGVNFILDNLWISCSEALPPLNTSVIVRAEDNDVYIAKLVSIPDEDELMWEGEYSFLDFVMVTHWAEVPAFGKLHIHKDRNDDRRDSE